MKTTPIDEQHLKYLQRQAERAAFMYSALEGRAAWADSPDVKEFIKYLSALVDEYYPQESLYEEPAA